MSILNHGFRLNLHSVGTTEATRRLNSAIARLLPYTVHNPEMGAIVAELRQIRNSLEVGTDG